MELTLEEALQKAVEAHKAGQIQEADRLYTAILKAQPKHPDANHNLGVLAVGVGKVQEALPFFKTALEANPNISQYWLSYIDALINLDRMIDAKSLLDQAKVKGAKGEAYNVLEQRLNALNEVSIDPSKDQLQQLINLYQQGQLQQTLDSAIQLLSQFPNSLILYNIQGAANAGLGHFETAIDSYKQALKIKPDYAEAYNNMGVAQNSKGDPESAIQSYKKALNIKPIYPEAYNNMGIALKSQGDLENALRSFKQALKIKSDYAEAYANMGNALQGNGELEAAIKSYKQALKIRPDYAEAFYNIGMTLHQQGYLDSAIDNLSKALQIKPCYAEAYNSMGNILYDKSDHEGAISNYKQALKLKPNDADVYNNMGIALQGFGDLKGATDNFHKALKIKPNLVEAYFNMGIALQDGGHLNAALDSFTKGLEIKPDDQQYRSQKLYLQACICDWIGVREEGVLISELGTTTQHISPFSMLALEDAPDRHRLRSEIYSNHTFKQTPLPLPSRPLQKPKRLRIGYFSADFKNHPVMYGLVEILERHNRKLFEIYAYSFGPDTDDEMRLRVINAVDVFDDVKNMTDQDIARLVRQDSIDIAIDLTGFTQNSRTGIFAYRAAPIQVSMLGYPGTLGANFMDYFIADQTLIPPENQKFYSENPIYVPQPPCGLEASIPLLEETPMRSELGLPVEGFVFCAINNTYKITPAEFDIWMRLLHHVEGSVLWLLESNRWAKTNLIKEAKARGISSERLVFQPKMVKDRDSQQRYLSQFTQADLYLDTFIYGGGSTAANALWAGLPVLTLIGQGLTTRMAASYLNALGLFELITTTSKDYERLAFELSKNPERLALLKQKLADEIKSEKLFDNTILTQYIESGYQQAYQRYFNGKNPSPIYIAE
jgi:predicted O-linked N-acetylglucosamine transferase (SPINDLY family)